MALVAVLTLPALVEVDVNGAPVPVAFNAVGFYDYQSHDWFTARIAAGHSVTTGPYIDVGGIDVCTITLGIALKAASGGTAVIGADLPIPGSRQCCCGR